MVPEYCMLSIQKGQKEKSKFFNGLVICIVSYRYHFASIGIVSYRKKIKGTHPYTHANLAKLFYSLQHQNCLPQKW